MDVFLVVLKSTGERWHTIVCSSDAAVKRVLAEYNIVEIVYQGTTAEYAEYVNPQDISQSASVQRVRLVE